MTRHHFALLGLILGLSTSKMTLAQVPLSSAKSPAATAKPLPANQDRSKLPKGHPPTGAMPPGHPPTGAMPPGHPPTGAMPPGHPPVNRGPDRRPANHPSTTQGNVFQPRPDRVNIDQTLPAGTVKIRIVDADGKAIPKAPITLHILRNSVERGETREQKNQTSDDNGVYRFDGLTTGSGISYRISTAREAAIFSSAPFGLKDQHGISVVLHSYKPATRLEDALLFIEAVVLLDIKQDAISVNHLLRTINLGRTAFVPKQMRIQLPEDYSAFNTQKAMSGVAIEARKDGTAELVGTFPPGKAELTYRYNIPLPSSDGQALHLPLPPRVVATTVLLGAGPGMGLEIGGFPPAQSGRRRDGQRVLQTVRRADMSMGVAGLMRQLDEQTLQVKISGIPSPGPARWIALALAIGAVGGGASFLRKGQQKPAAAWRRERRDDLRQAKATLLDEMVALQRARNAGDIGPRSYQRLKEALLDALARIVSLLEAVTEPNQTQARTSKQKTGGKPRPTNKRRSRGKPKT